MGSALPECQGSYNIKTWTNCTGRHTFNSPYNYNFFKSGKKYQGGFGKGHTYAGGWRYGLPHGKGTYNFEDGNKYVGELKYDTRHGQGTQTFPDGRKYVGEYKNGKRNGQGTLTFANGDKYVGGFKDGRIHGPGTYTYANGDKYVGEFKDGRMLGQGTQTFGSNSKTGGDKYVGGFKDGRMHGPGTYTYANGDKYVGEYKNGKLHGQGVYTFEDGHVNEGKFKDDNFQYSQKTLYSRKAYFLQTAFKKLSKEKRKKLQSNLKDLGFYKSSIDGLYGKGTEAALTGYNKQILNGKSLKNFENVLKLFNAVLGLPPPSTNKIESVPVAKSPNQNNDTYKVASGTGFYVSNEGHIITNHHVIEGCEDIKVHYKGSILETKKISEDRRNDLALLKTSATPKHSFALSTESSFPLQEIIVAGYPFGEKVSSTLKFTQGIVSSIAGLGNDYSQIQIDAALQPGNSGGPILDEYGNVVAVAVAKLSLKKILKDYGVVPENTNFGVKESAVRNLMEGNGVSFKSPNKEVISKRELSQVATDGTVYLTCWMTTAQIEQMRARKVLFEDLE
ncbi:trypsin-like peptidase domain-containing protein [Paracoccaceae bacterium]|nr:trypsin-like peptidase domain-containing protein [Paracoccaceae bacterium]